MIILNAIVTILGKIFTTSKKEKYLISEELEEDKLNPEKFEFEN